VDYKLDALLDIDHFFRQGALAQLDAGARLVNQVDSLVGQKTVRDVAARKVYS